MPSLQRLSPPPIRVDLYDRAGISRAWLDWFQQLFQLGGVVQDQTSSITDLQTGSTFDDRSGVDVDARIEAALLAAPAEAGRHTEPRLEEVLFQASGGAGRDFSAEIEASREVLGSTPRDYAGDLDALARLVLASDLAPQVTRQDLDDLKAIVAASDPMTSAATGPQGPAGTAATVSVGTTTTGAAGSSASVSNSGSSSAAVLNFTIPQGATGATGPQGTAGTNGTNVQAYTAVAHQWINAISAAGAASSTQPAFSDISGTISTSQVPTLNQNTTGTAANVTGTVAVANGGTGQTTASAALTALGGASLTAANVFTGSLQTIQGPSSNNGHFNFIGLSGVIHPGLDIYPYGGGSTPSISLRSSGAGTGSGPCYFNAGNTLFGNTTDNGVDKVQVTGSINATSYRVGAVAGASGTISLAKLTSTGANGSITVSGGIITAFTNPT